MFSLGDNQRATSTSYRPVGLRNLPPALIALAVTLFLLAACAGRPDPPRPTRPADNGSTGDPALVQATKQTSWQAANVTREFVVRVELKNLNHVQVKMRASDALDYPGLDRVVVAILAGPLGSGTPDLDTIRSAVPLPVTLDENQVATLAIAGHLRCEGDAAQPDDVPIVVDGQATTITMPAIEGDNWATAMTTIIC